MNTEDRVQILDANNKEEVLKHLTPGKYTIGLQGRAPIQSVSPQKQIVKVTVLGPARRYGWSSNGSWFLHKPKQPETTPHYVLPVRKYRKQSSTAFWIGFITDIKKGW